jgi:hypothetical protein
MTNEASNAFQGSIKVKTHCRCFPYHFPSPKMWECVFFTCPENEGVRYFHLSRKSGGAYFSRLQKMWESVIFTSSENLGVWCLHLSRNSGRALFPHVPKMWACVIFTCPGSCGKKDYMCEIICLIVTLYSFRAIFISQPNK